MCSLNEKAMLVNLKVGTWAGYAYSKDATMDGFGSTDLGRANKALLKHSNVFKKTKAAFNTVRSYVNENTLPWKDDGVRLLPSANYMDFVQGLGDVKREAETQLKVFMGEYTNEISNDKVRFENEALKSGKLCLFSFDDYPLDIQHKFYIELGFEPIPSSSDFRVQISEDDKRALDAAVAKAQEDVTTHLIEEMAKPMRALAEHLSRPVEDVKRFHDSIVLNVSDQVERLQKLNLNDDPTVNALLKEVRGAFSTLARQPEVLKDNQPVRDAARVKLAEMMKNFGMGV